MANEYTKLNNIKMALLGLLFVLMFAFAYFLLYVPIKVNDSQLLTISMIFSAFVVAIPLYVFMKDDKEETTQIKTEKKSKKKSKK